MTGHKPFSDLTRDFTPARRARVAAKAAALGEAMTLEELRKARSSLSGRRRCSTHGQPARRREAGKAWRHACEQSAPLHRGARRHTRNHRALRQDHRRHQQHRGTVVGRGKARSPALGRPDEKLRDTHRSSATMMTGFAKSSTHSTSCRLCERSEAIQFLATEESLDCFAALAMTTLTNSPSCSACRGGQPRRRQFVCVYWIAR